MILGITDILRRNFTKTPHTSTVGWQPRGQAAGRGLPLLPCLLLCILLGLLLLMHSSVFAASPAMSAEELNLRIQEIFKKGPYARERGGDAPVLKCATPIIRYALRHKELLWPENRFILYRPTYGGATELTYNSLGGNFRIHYTESGTHAVYGSDGNPDTRPTFITDLASYFEYTWSEEVEDMQYLPPAPDGSIGGDTNLFDVYVMNITYYGYTQPEDDRIFIVVHNTFTGDGFSSNLDPDGPQAGNMKVTAAHEFFHSIQYEYSEWEDSGEWWEENSAVWMEDKVYDQVDDYLRYLPDRLDNLHLPLDNEDYMYGGVIWAQFLSESYGDKVIRHIFERFFIDASTAKTAIQYTLTDRGSGWGEAMSQFSLKNLTLDYEEGANYLLRHTSADYFPDVIPTTVSDSQIEAGYASGNLNVSHLAADYIMIEAGAEEKELRIRLTPQSANTPVTLFVADMNAAGDVSPDSNTLQVWPHIGVEHTLDGFGGAYKRAFLIVINPDPVSNTCTYTWTADFITPELSAPSILSPVSGTILTFEQGSPPFPVTLSVANVPPVDPNSSNEYAFEVYVYRHPDFALAGSQVIQEDPNGITSFQTGLSDADTFYFWRCRAQDMDTNTVSPWTPLACFYPLTVSTESTAKSFPDPNDKLIEVTDANSPILGASLQIDQLLDPNDECFIARVLYPPPATGEVIPVGSWVFFGPDNDTIAGAATIRLTYTQQALDAAGVTDPNGMVDPNRLGIYYYHLDNPYLSVSMTRIASLHDANTQTLQGDVTHLSLFVVGYSTETSIDPNSQNSDTGPGNIIFKVGGGCFITSLP